MRSTGSWSLVLVLLSACTRPNPLFASGEDGEGEGEGEVTNGEVTTSGQVTGGEVGDATRTTSADASAEGPITTDASATTEVAVDSGVLDTGSACELMFGEPFGIVAEPSLETVLGSCQPIAFLNVGVGTAVGGDVMGVLCDGTCSTCGEMPISLGFDAPLPASLSGCFELALELDGDCNVLAYTITTNLGPPPRVVVSNVVNPSLMYPFSVSLGDVPFQVCDEGCMPASGYYPLALPDGTEVLPGNIAIVPGPFPYAMTSAGSGIDANCEPVARWYAVLD